MADFAGARLATAVTMSGGLGFIGSAIDTGALSIELEKAASLLSSLQITTTCALPISVGFLIFTEKLEDVVSVMTRDFAVWTKAMHTASPESCIWIQVASVAVAVEVARLYAPDVLVLQAADAGRYGPSPGTGLVGLIPEARDVLDKARFSKISVVGVGGIGDGRGVAAALACGADGVLIGTAFLASVEVDLPAKEYQEAILEVVNGGVSTVRATIFDEMCDKITWPTSYDGRALASPSYKDYLDGDRLDKLRKKYADYITGPDKGFGGERRAVI